MCIYEQKSKSNFCEIKKKYAFMYWTFSSVSLIIFTFDLCFFV